VGWAISVQRREKSFILRQRPKRIFPRLLIGQAWRRLHFPDGDRGDFLPRGGRAARWRGRAAHAGRDGRAARERSEARFLDASHGLGGGAFQRQLKGAQGGDARDYLARREISPAAQTHFRIGYAPPDRHGLRDALAAKGVGVEAMIEAGLLINGEDIAVPYDRFRHRLMFPIHDRGGAVIAFGGGRWKKTCIARRKTGVLTNALLPSI